MNIIPGTDIRRSLQRFPTQRPPCSPCRQLASPGRRRSASPVRETYVPLHRSLVETHRRSSTRGFLPRVREVRLSWLLDSPGVTAHLTQREKNSTRSHLMMYQPMACVQKERGFTR